MQNHLSGFMGTAALAVSLALAVPIAANAATSPRPERRAGSDGCATGPSHLPPLEKAAASS